MKVVVTGANGFVGSALCQHLLSAGHSVRALVRREAALRDVPAASEGCLLPEDGDLGALLRGTDAIVHLIARTHVMQEGAADPLLLYRAVNVTLTETLVQAALRAGVKRLVYVSSIKAVGENRAEAYLESDPPHPQDAYGVSKLEAERRLHDLTAGEGLEPVILRPPLVYGAGVKGNLRRLLGALSKGVPLPFGGVRNARSMVGLANLTSAIGCVLVHPAAAGETFHVADDEQVSSTELLQRLAHLLGVRARLVPLPAPLLRSLGRLSGRSGEIERLLGSLTVSNSKLEQQLGWRPPLSLEAGLSEMVAAYHAQGQV